MWKVKTRFVDAQQTQPVTKGTEKLVSRGWSRSDELCKLRRI